MAKETKKKEVIEIDLDRVAIPSAIILAGIIIAGAIFFTNRGQSSSGAVDSAQDSDTQQEEFPEASTIISNGPYLGDIKKAKVALVEYTDYQCPYCQRHAEQTKPTIIKEYVDTGKIIYVVRNYPLDFHGQIAVDSAHAGFCVNEIGGASKFFEFYSQAFLKTSTDELASVASSLGINMDKYTTCMNENRYADDVKNDFNDGASAGVMGTPGFVIGVLDKDGNVEGRLIGGAYPYETFKAMLDEYLE